MEHLTDLKAVLHSKRANIYYLEKCRVMVKDGRVVYLTEDKNQSNYWNIPIANTTVILLSTGTSITQAAVRMLASAGVLIGFCGTGGTPLIAGSEIEWISPQSEYRPTEYVQGWLSFWFDEEKRLNAAKEFQKARISYIKKVWDSDKEMQSYNFYIDDKDISNALNISQKIEKAQTIQELLTIEANLAKQLYKIAANRTKISDFTRSHNIDSKILSSSLSDTANSFLNHGNYLAYGLAATTLWVLGIPHGFAVMHGKTRRGALVFDAADLVKDALILPLSFISAKEELSEEQFREQCLIKFTKHKALDFMFEQVKKVAQT